MMSRRQFLAGLLVFSIAGFMLLFTSDAFAQFGTGDFENKVESLTSGLISKVLPAISILGLLYAAALAASGDASSKGRISLVVFASAVGMLAPAVIRMLQGFIG